MEILHDLGLSVSYSSIQNKKKELIKAQEKRIKETVTSYVDARISDPFDRTHLPIEILGDNVDITISPTKMTMEKQRKSLHWFLIMAKQKRITYEDVHVSDAQIPPRPIGEAQTASWVPSEAVIQNVESDMQYHISRILVKYIDFIKENINYPDCLEHKYSHLTKKKSVVLNCELVEESENSSQGMITILQKVHQLAVPHVDRQIVKKVVFGGDVLTNERAFSAQEAMQNNQSEFDNLLGITHRPEGLHREMNFLMVS